MYTKKAIVRIQWWNNNKIHWKLGFLSMLSSREFRHVRCNGVSFLYSMLLLPLFFHHFVFFISCFICYPNCGHIQLMSKYNVTLSFPIYLHLFLICFLPTPSIFRTKTHKIHSTHEFQVIRVRLHVIPTVCLSIYCESEREFGIDNAFQLYIILFFWLLCLNENFCPDNKI